MLVNNNNIERKTKSTEKKLIHLMHGVALYENFTLFTIYTHSP